MSEHRDQSNVVRESTDFPGQPRGRGDTITTGPAEPERRGYMCVVQWVIDGTTLYAMPFIWSEVSAERAARAASHLELPPNHKRYRITVVELQHSESFQWTGNGEVSSERVS